MASLGLQAGGFSETVYAVIIAMSLLTPLIAPPALKALFASVPLETDEGVSYPAGVEETGHA